jgi:hypothetical protein
MSIGARFLEIRKAKGLKQTDVAEAIGISHGALVNYEKGREPPASAILQPSLWRQRTLASDGRRPTRCRKSGQHLCPLHRDRLGFLKSRSDDVEQEALIKLGGALFQYLLEHGEISPAMSEKIFALSA